jgi:hypothetical protein
VTGRIGRGTRRIGSRSRTRTHRRRHALSNKITYLQLSRGMDAESRPAPRGLTHRPIPDLSGPVASAVHSFDV